MTSPAPVNVPEKSLMKLAFLAAGCEELQKKDLKLKTLWRHELQLLSTADKLK